MPNLPTTTPTGPGDADISVFVTTTEFHKFKDKIETHLANQDLVAQVTKELAQDTHREVQTAKEIAKDTNAKVERVMRVWTGDPTEGKVGMFSVMVNLEKQMASAEEDKKKKTDGKGNAFWQVVVGVVIAMFSAFIGLIGFLAVYFLKIKPL